MPDRPFAEVIVFSSGQDEAFTYHIPEGVGGPVGPGSLVTVPFGPRRLYGIVVALAETSPVAQTKAIEALIDAQPVLTPQALDLARWMSAEWLAPLAACLALWLPPGLVGDADVRLALNPGASLEAAKTPAQRALLALLARRGPLRGGQVALALKGVDWRSAAQQLVERRVIARTPILAPPAVRPKRVHRVRLAPGVGPGQALARLRSPTYRRIVDFLGAEGGPVEISWVYAETGCTRAHLDRLAERGLVVLEAEEVWRDPLAGRVFVPAEPPPLTPDQAEVWEAIRPSLAADSPTCAAFLLHGVTGSGKTEIYLRAVAETLARGRRALVLVPEIALTPQTVERFEARFPGRVGVIHSALSPGERYDTWRRARAGALDVVIGARSALFTPLAPLGLVVLDEEHDASYKQQSPPPRYHARSVALELGRRLGATVILGSATPSLEAFHLAQEGAMRLLQMPRRIVGHARRLRDLQAYVRAPAHSYRPLGDGGQVWYRPLPPVRIVDLRAELRAGNRSVFSRALQEALDQALRRGEQAILFLNRRGSATFILCRDCGHVLRCPRCEIPLTHHAPQRLLICHRCNYRQAQPARCPVCTSERIRYFGLGTEQVEQAVRERWPGARLLRWDADTARSAAAHAAILRQFMDGSADVLVGTQMIAKGLDLPLVTVVGVISADTALNLPDFRARERTFQLLAQVAGRAGRGLLGGQVIVQTYRPDDPAIVAAARHDYAGFALAELAFRRTHAYPPYARLTRLLY